MPQAGDTLTAIIYLEDEFGDPITGVTQNLTPLSPVDGTIRVISALDPNGTSFADDVGIAEITPPGSYLVSYVSPTTAPLGDYVLQLVYDDTVDQPWTVEWEIETPWNITYPVTVNTGITRREIRRDVLGRVGDLMVCTATATGSTTEFVDTNNFVLEPGAYKGRYALFTGGTAANLGLIRYVEKSSRDMAKVGFSTALPQATQAGDEIELTNTYGQGFTFPAVHAAINRAIRYAREDALISIKAVASDPFDATTRLITTPETMAVVENVQWQDSETSQWYDLERANTYGDTGWALDHADHAIYVAGRPGELISEKSVRILGLGEPPPLEDDNDVSQVDPEWLIYKVLEDLTGNLVVMGSRTSKYWQAHQMYSARANELYPRLIPNLGPSAQRFRA